MEKQSHSPRRITSFPRFRWSPSSTSTRSDDSPPVAGHHRSLVTVANPKQKQTPTVAASPAASAAPAAFATPRQPKGKRIIRPRDLFNQRPKPMPTPKKVSSSDDAPPFGQPLPSNQHAQCGDCRQGEHSFKINFKVLFVSVISDIFISCSVFVVFKLTKKRKKRKKRNLKKT